MTAPRVVIEAFNEDEAFFSWFAHQAPSSGVSDQYAYLGTFTQPSPLC